MPETTLDELNTGQTARNKQFEKWVKAVADAFKKIGITATYTITGGSTSGPYVLPNMAKMKIQVSSGEWQTNLMHGMMDSFPDPATFVGDKSHWDPKPWSLNWWQTQKKDVPGTVGKNVGSPAPTQDDAVLPETQPGPVTGVDSVFEPTIPPEQQKPIQPDGNKLSVIDQMRTLSKSGQENWDGWGYYYRQVTGKAAPSPESRGVQRVSPMPLMSVEDWWRAAFGEGEGEPSPPAPGKPPQMPILKPIPIPEKPVEPGILDAVEKFLKYLIQLLFGGAKPPKVEPPEPPEKGFEPRFPQ